MKIRLGSILLIVLLLVTTEVSSQSYFQQETNYKINATLDTTTKSLYLKMDLAYTNNADVALDYIYFHLWWNCFSDKSSAFADQQLANGMRDFYFAKDDELGGYEMIDFKQDGVSLTQGTYSDANNKNLVDVTQVKLDKTVAAGETIHIQIEAQVKIPKLFSRGGLQEDLFRFTQWYPKPAVYDNEGWHPMPYLDAGEFYSEYGDYELTFNIPTNMSLVATGVKTGEKVVDGMKQISFTAEEVPDYAWSCSKNFYTKERSVQLSAKLVDLTLFTNYEEGYDEVLGYMEDALKFYSDQVGTYPYPQYTLVLSKSSSRGGMEYPMLSIIDLDYLGQSMDNLIAHEIGHNWFQSALGSNERIYPWIDEGFNSFVERKYNDSKYPEPNYNYILPKFYRTDNQEYSVMQAGICHLHCCGRLGAIDQPSDAVDVMTYGSNSYERMAFSLSYLESYLGEPSFKAAMHSLYANWKHKHPSPNDVQAIFEAATDKDLSWFFDGLIKQLGYFDYKIEKVEDTNADVEVLISNKEDLHLPIQLSAYDKAGKLVSNEWVEIANQRSEIKLPSGDYSKISINGETPFLDLNRRNNHYHPGKLLKRAPINFRLLGQQADSYKSTVSFVPTLGYNAYDGLMLGVDIHNEFFPYNNTRWHIQPAFGLNNKTLAGIFALEQDVLLLDSPALRKLTFGLSGRRFSVSDFSTENLVQRSYYKLRPKVTLHFDNGLINNSRLEYTFHYVKEDVANLGIIDFTYREIRSQVHQLNYVAIKKKRLGVTELLVQLEYEAYEDAFNVPKNYLKLSIDRSSSFYYNADSRLFLRFFGGYFLLNSQRASSSFTGEFTSGSFALTQQGYTDHTYEGFYFDRVGQSGTLSRQLMQEEGGFKMPLGSSFPIGMSNDYMIAVNLKADLPISLFKNARLRPFFDLGYLSTKRFQSDPLEGQFLYSAGLAFEIGDAVGLYLPLLYSDAFDVPLQGRSLLGKLSFKLDITKLSPWRLAEDPGMLLR